MDQPSPCLRTASELSALTRSLRKYIVHSGPRKAQEIKDLETMFDLYLPRDYRQFLGSYGALLTSQFAVLGLGDVEKTGIPVSDAILAFRLSHPDIPLELLPIEDLGQGRFACLICNKQSTEYSPVVEIDVNHPLPLAELSQLAPCFRNYLYDRLQQLAAFSSVPDQELEVLEKHVEEYQAKFGYDHATGGKLPRNHDWRPYRFCIQDVLFGATVVRHLREANCLQVDVFLTAHIPEYDPLAGAQALTAFLLSEAYKCGGTMEIRFTNNVENGRVPAELQELAARYDVHFNETAKGRVSPAEAKSLYATLTEFSAELQERINQLEQAGKLKMARACYVVHHGVWTKEQVEMIVLGSQRPDRILSGLTQPHQRHLYLHDLHYARAALLGGMLDRRLTKRERYGDDGTPYDLEDDIRSLIIKFEGEAFAKQYESQEPILVPWLYEETRDVQIAPGISFWVLVRARDAADILMHLQADIKLAEQLRQRTGQPTAILVPNDFMGLPSDLGKRYAAQVQAARVGLMVCPETVSTLDADAAQRLAQSRILRQ
jgi:hypothetical protein